MEYKEYRTVDKTTWPRGEWDDEPDKVQFVDTATGLPCLIKRSYHYADGTGCGSGNLCGYVGIPPGHPLHGGHAKELDDMLETSVHGGLTYEGFCQEVDDERHGICHVPGPDEPENIYWYGFDCGHGYDFQPGWQAMLNEVPTYIGARYGMEDEYRNIEYVKNQCAILAAQLKAYEVR